MAIRQIKGLKWARQLPGRPKCIPTSRPRGAKAEGLRYERALAKRLPLAAHGVWFEFADSNGPGYCQPDFLLTLPNGALAILECKYTWVAEAHAQLAGLYAPVVREARGADVVGVVVCKRLVEGMKGTVVTADLWHACQLAFAGLRPVLHWLGKSTVAGPRLLDCVANLARGSS